MNLALLRRGKVQSRHDYELDELMDVTFCEGGDLRIATLKIWRTAPVCPFKLHPSQQADHTFVEAYKILARGRDIHLR
eukprot:763948-Amphidinium_carterae.1